MPTQNVNRSLLSAFGGMPTYSYLAAGVTAGANVIYIDIFNARRQ